MDGEWSNRRVVCQLVCWQLHLNRIAEIEPIRENLETRREMCTKRDGFKTATVILYWPHLCFSRLCTRNDGNSHLSSTPVVYEVVLADHKYGRIYMYDPYVQVKLTMTTRHTTTRTVGGLHPPRSLKVQWFLHSSSPPSFLSFDRTIHSTVVPI